jgi:outer membrane protein
MKKLALALAVLTFCGAAQAKEGDLIVRMRAISVTPDVSSTSTLNAINADVNTKVVPELDFTYMWTNNIGTELILGTARHSVNTSLGNLGKVSVLPPTLTVQYHFIPDGKIRPYAGIGVNYTHFYNNDLHVGSTPVDIKSNSFGLAAQVGADFQVSQDWAINADIKKFGLRTKASIGGASLGTLKIDPWVFGIGVTRTFSLK